MKKQNLVAVVGTLALMLNILLPGLALGADQTGTLDIDCGSAVTSVAMTDSPANMTFVSKSVTVGGSIQSSVSNLAATDTAAGYLDNTTLLQVNGSTIEDCEATMTDWSVKASAITFTNTDNADTILNSDLHAQVSKLVENVAGDAKLVCDNETVFCVDTQTVGPLTTYANLSSSCKVDTAASWSDASTFACALDTDQTLMAYDHTALTDQGFNGVANAGVTLAIKDGIAIDQAPGTYTSTITYTFAEAL